MVYMVSFEVRKAGSLGKYQWETTSVLADSERLARGQAREQIAKRLGFAIDTRACCLDGNRPLLP